MSREDDLSRLELHFKAGTNPLRHQVALIVIAWLCKINWLLYTSDNEAYESRMNIRNSIFKK